MSIDESASFTVTERVGDVSLSHTIYLKDRRVFVTETVGEVSADSEISYDDLPEAVLKAYRAWITNVQV
jgi:hypothetical protein